MKCQEVTVKKKRVETFRNIRYPVGGRQRAQVVRLGGLAPARPTSEMLSGSDIGIE